MKPEFPSSYPPALPELNNSHMVSLAFDPRRNQRLEYLGDALVDVAIYRSIHAQFVDHNVMPPPEILDLRSGTQLAHLSLLYGLQLHIYNPHRRRGVNPSLETMCDIFEAFVAAVALDCGFEETLRWLVLLLDPWVATYPRTGASTTTRLNTGYRACVYHFRVDAPAPHPSGVNMAALTAFGPGHVGLRRPDSLIMPDIPACTIDFPASYPPLPPPFLATDAQVLTDALTTEFCRLYFGGAVVGNERYRAFGYILWKAAICTVSYKRLPSAKAELLNEIGIECMEPAFSVHLGLMFHLNEYLRILRPVGEEDTRLASAAQAGDGFHALIAAVYLQRGWDIFIDWIDRLLSPWIVAAALGGFRLSTGAQLYREDVEKQRLQAAVAKAREAVLGRLKKLASDEVRRRSRDKCTREEYRPTRKHHR
ncbi:hypothetical protein C8R46DRAFT_671272 [Mycena filopes]|nr:hypothetical protein C8R46DRAFT_671272 [Mycena filopes]